MRPKEERIVISFNTTTMAMDMERKCKASGEDGRLIPLPKEISAGCGLAWAGRKLDTVYWEKYMAENLIEYDKIKQMMI